MQSARNTCTDVDRSDPNQEPRRLTADGIFELSKKGRMDKCAKRGQHDKGALPRCTDP